MNCKNCGNQVGDGMKFCPECGADMLEQSAEALNGEIVEEDGSAAGDGWFPPDQNMTVKEGVETVSAPKKVGEKLNIGYIGVLAASILALVAAFIKNSGGRWNDYSIVMLLSYYKVGDGKTYIMILAVLLVATIILGYFQKILLMLITSLISTGWIIYILNIFIRCGESILNGMGLLLFLAGGILLVISAIAAFKIGRNQKA